MDVFDISIYIYYCSLVRIYKHWFSIHASTSCLWHFHSPNLCLPSLSFFFDGLVWLALLCCSFVVHRTSRGHTDSICRCVVCHLCKSTTPRTAPSLPLACRRTFHFFHSPLFFPFPTTRTTSPTSGAFAPLQFTRWLSNKPYAYSHLPSFPRVVLCLGKPLFQFR